MTKPTRSRSAIGRANLTKGKAMERALVAYLRTHGWPSAERTVRTGYRVAGRTSRDRGDVDGTPCLAWQAKAVAEAKHHLLRTWLAEAEAQRVAAKADYAVLVVKRAGHAHPGDWWAYVPLAEFICLTGGPRPQVAGFDAFAPVRLELAGLLPLLWAAGYGTPPFGEELAPRTTSPLRCAPCEAAGGAQ